MKTNEEARLAAIRIFESWMLQQRTFRRSLMIHRAVESAPANLYDRSAVRTSDGLRSVNGKSQ